MVVHSQVVNIFAIAIAGSCGALLRWVFGLFLNALFPSLPLGTLAANLLGAFLIGMVMAVTRDHPFFPEAVRLAITTGFLGALTTFSTFSAETVHLLLQAQYGWALLAIFAHLLGSLGATFFGLYLTQRLIL